MAIFECLTVCQEPLPTYDGIVYVSARDIMAIEEYAELNLQLGFALHQIGIRA